MCSPQQAGKQWPGFGGDRDVPPPAPEGCAGDSICGESLELGALVSTALSLSQRVGSMACGLAVPSLADPYLIPGRDVTPSGRLGQEPLGFSYFDLGVP